MTENGSLENECCPKFEPSNWDDKTFTWNNKKFIKDKVCTFFYMPCNFSSVMKKLMKILEGAGMSMSDNICLSEHTSMWNMNLYLSVDKDVAGVENTSINGNIYSKVYEGPFKDTGKWAKDFENVVKSKNLKLSKMYFWYTTCPKCAKKYGKNYVVLLGVIE